VKVSVIGVGMRSHAGIAQRMFKALAEKGINIQVISTSEIKISVLVAEEYTELAVRACTPPTASTPPRADRDRANGRRTPRPC
jgi:aspartokinase